MTEAVACICDSKAIVLYIEGSRLSPLDPAPSNHTMSNAVAASLSDIGGSNFQNAMDTSTLDNIFNQSDRNEGPDDEDSDMSSLLINYAATDIDEHAATTDAAELKV